MKDDYTLVVGVDQKHIRQLRMVWPTWVRHKPSLLQRRMVLFCDRESVTETDVQSLRRFLDHSDLTVIAWPADPKIKFEGSSEDKWYNPQRYKMLSGFVHVAAEYVRTLYWLKLDTDVVATGNDSWMDPKWFEDRPAIISHPWGYTKPADQMLLLDQWATTSVPVEFPLPPLNLAPNPGSDVLRHSRIISWCAFFDTAFTRDCSRLASTTCGIGKLPVPSQDGFMWYCAQRMGKQIKQVRMKPRGWAGWNTEQNIRKAVEEALQCVVK